MLNFSTGISVCVDQLISLLLMFNINLNSNNINIQHVKYAKKLLDIFLVARL